jgi:hypothetical protein
VKLIGDIVTDKRKIRNRTIGNPGGCRVGRLLE